MVPNGERLEPEIGNPGVLGAGDRERRAFRAVDCDAARPTPKQMIDVRALDDARQDAVQEGSHMALTLTQAELSAAIRLGDSTEETAEATRLLGYVTAAISRTWATPTRTRLK